MKFAFESISKSSDNNNKMAMVYEIRKPMGQYNLALPAYFRQVFGVWWDILYGMLAIASFALITLFEIDRNFYLLLTNTYFDLVIIFDASLSLFVRFYQSVQVIAVNRYIEAVYIAAWNMLGFTLDLISCLPFVLFLIFMDRESSRIAYQIVCLLRFIRLYLSARRFLDKSLYEKVFERKEVFNDINMGDFGVASHYRTRKNARKFSKKLH